MARRLTLRYENRKTAPAARMIARAFHESHAMYTMLPAATMAYRTTLGSCTRALEMAGMFSVKAAVNLAPPSRSSMARGADVMLLQNPMRRETRVSMVTFVSR